MNAITEFIVDEPGSDARCMGYRLQCGSPYTQRRHATRASLRSFGDLLSTINNLLDTQQLLALQQIINIRYLCTIYLIQSWPSTRCIPTPFGWSKVVLFFISNNQNTEASYFFTHTRLRSLSCEELPD